MFDKNLEYWQNKLTRLPVLELITDKLRSSERDYETGIETFVFAKELCESEKILIKALTLNYLRLY